MKQLNSIFHGQCPSTPPGHPEETRLHFCLCCHIPSKPDQDAASGLLGRQLVGRAPEIWRVVLTMRCGRIWSNGIVLHTSEAVTCKNFIAVKIPLHWAFIQVPGGCYIEKLDCSLLFSCRLPRLHTICGAHSSFSSVYREAQVSAEPLAMFVIKGVWGKGWLVVLSQRPQIIQTRCQVRSGLNSWIMLPHG